MLIARTIRNTQIHAVGGIQGLSMLKYLVYTVTTGNWVVKLFDLCPYTLLQELYLFLQQTFINPFSDAMTQITIFESVVCAVEERCSSFELLVTECNSLTHADWARICKRGPWYYRPIVINAGHVVRPEQDGPCFHDRNNALLSLCLGEHNGFRGELMFLPLSAFSWSYKGIKPPQVSILRWVAGSVDWGQRRN
jgi:hypothetical protein